MAPISTYAKQQNITGNTINNAGTGSIYNYVYYPKYGANIKNNTLNDVYYGFYCYGMPTTATAETHWEVENNNINSRYIGLLFLRIDNHHVTKLELDCQEKQHCNYWFLYQLWHLLRLR